MGGLPSPNPFKAAASSAIMADQQRESRAVAASTANTRDGTNRGFVENPPKLALGQTGNLRESTNIEDRREPTQTAINPQTPKPTTMILSQQRNFMSAANDNGGGSGVAPDVAAPGSGGQGGGYINQNVGYVKTPGATLMQPSPVPAGRAANTNAFGVVGGK